MFSALNYGASARFRLESSSNDLQKLFELSSTTIEEVLSFPNIVSELHAPIATHGFFTNDRIEQLISIVFDSTVLRKYSYDEGRKYAYLASEILSSRVSAISDYFFHKESPAGAAKKQNKVDELDVENDFEVGKDLLLSPVNSVKSKSAQVIEVCNKAAVSGLIAKALNRQHLDETRAGYLTKILYAFFQRSKNEVLAFFYKSGFDYRQFLGYLDFYAFTDFLNNVVLYENNMTNDSMIFQDMQQQLNPEFGPIRVEFLGQIVTAPEIKASFEVASNVKQLLEAFFSKFRNIAEADEIMREIFLKQGYFARLREWLAEVQDPAVAHEILAIIKIISAFLLLATTSKAESLSEGTKAMFHLRAPVHTQLLELTEALKAQLPVPRPKQAWINSFMQATPNSGVRNQVCLLDIFTNLMKQRVCDVSAAFLTPQFLPDLLVS